MPENTNFFQVFIHQQSEMFPEDFYIRSQSSADKVEFDPLNPPYKPLISGQLTEYEQQIHQCQRCPLGATRTKFVFGVGDSTAELMFVGEAPGYHEDQQGVPFVGRAGKLLDKILAAIDLTRDQVFIGNVLKCRPPDNRDPRVDEIDECEPYLVQQIKLVEPKVIIALGRVAGNTLLKTNSALRDLRGKTWNYHGTDLIVTYHPAALLRNQKLKYPAWEDFQKVQKNYLS